MKKAVPIVLFLALVTCAFSGCVENEFKPTPVPTMPARTAPPLPAQAIPTRTAVGIPPERLEQIYFDKATELNYRRISITTRSQDALADYIDGKTRLDVFKILYGMYTEDMYEVVNEMTSLNPPPRYREYHSHCLKSTNLLYSSMLEFTLYLEDGKMYHLSKATDLLEESIRETDLAKASIPT